MDQPKAKRLSIGIQEFFYQMSQSECYYHHKDSHITPEDQKY